MAKKPTESIILCKLKRKNAHKKSRFLKKGIGIFVLAENNRIQVIYSKHSYFKLSALSILISSFYSNQSYSKLSYQLVTLL